MDTIFTQLIEEQLEDVHKVILLFEEDQASISRGLGGEALSAYEKTIQIALTQIHDIRRQLKMLQGNV